MVNSESHNHLLVRSINPTMCNPPSSNDFGRGHAPSASHPLPQISTSPTITTSSRLIAASPMPLPQISTNSPITTSSHMIATYLVPLPQISINSSITTSSQLIATSPVPLPRWLMTLQLHCCSISNPTEVRPPLGVTIASSLPSVYLCFREATNFP